MRSLKGLNFPKNEFGKVSSHASPSSFFQPVTVSDPLITTFSPGADWKTIGLPSTPPRGGLISSR